MELLKLLSGNEIVAQVVSFLLLFFLLRVFFWQKLLKTLDARKERIASELKKIEDANLQVAKLKEEYEAQLNSIESMARMKIQEAVEEGKRINQEVRKQAQVESQEIIESARQNIKYELAKAKDELKDKIVDLAINAAENVIQEKLTEKSDKKLVEDFLDKIDGID